MDGLTTIFLFFAKLGSFVLHSTRSNLQNYIHFPLITWIIYKILLFSIIDIIILNNNLKSVIIT